MAENEKVTIKIQCKECGGTGLYRGYEEERTPGLAVICVDCKGDGAVDFSYTPFTGRILRRGIEIVKYSNGTNFVSDMGQTKNKISYQDFLDGKYLKK